MKLFNKNYILLIFTILFLLFTPQFGLCKKSHNILKRNFLFPRFLLKNDNNGQIDHQEKKIIERSVINEPIEVIDEEDIEEVNNEGDQSVFDINENILKSVRKPSSPSRRPCYFSPIQCLLHSPEHNRKFENYPEFQQNPRSFRTSKLLKIDEIIPKLKEENNLEEEKETNNNNQEQKNNNNKLFVKIENGQQQKTNNNIPNLKAALEQLLRNAQGKQKTRRILRQSNYLNIFDENINSINNKNDKEINIKREGKIGKFTSNPFRRPLSNSWLRGL